MRREREREDLLIFSLLFREQEQQLHHMMASSEYNRDTKTGGHVVRGGGERKGSGAECE